MTDTGGNRFGLDGKVAVVTGAGSQAEGIGNGRAAAVLLAEAGARVAVVDSVHARANGTRELIERDGGDCVVVEADVTDPAACRSAIGTVVDRWGRVDVLFNNVGIVGPDCTVEDADLDVWDHILRVNLTSMMLMSRYVVPQMRAVGGGSIVHMGSLAGLRGGHPSIAYSVSKGAVVNLTRAMAVAHGSAGIRVNSVAPGLVHTPLVSSNGLTARARDLRRRLAPLQREGTGWDVGRAVVFLASEQSSWITGVTVPVDAGLTSLMGITADLTVTAQN